VEEDTIMTELKTQIATLENEISIMEMETEETVAIQDHKKKQIEDKLGKIEDKGQRLTDELKNAENIAAITANLIANTEESIRSKKVFNQKNAKRFLPST